MQSKLFVVTIASEKGGVGKTTIATNLAVYLKALREDLPVTIASFDNHFSVDNMFAISRSGSGTVAALLTSRVPHRHLALGEYGVQYFPSVRNLPPLRGKIAKLGNQLAASELEGILVLDTRPILDDYTASALLAADLVLVPVKDRASLVNAGSLLQRLATSQGSTGHCWLIPSLIDGRLRVRGDLGMDDYLRCNAEERNYQVFEGFISKSPKVEGLANGFSSRIPAVITHARGTLVHRQFRKLAEFVLKEHDQCRTTRSQLARIDRVRETASPGHLRRLQAECPICQAGIQATAGALYLHLRSRRRGLIHPECLAALLKTSNLPVQRQNSGLLVFDIDGSGLSGGQGRVRLRRFDAAGEEQPGEQCDIAGRTELEDFLSATTGLVIEDMLRELVLVTDSTQSPVDLLSGPGREKLRTLRRQALRTIFCHTDPAAC